MPAATSPQHGDTSNGRDGLDNLLDEEDFWNDMPQPDGANANNANNTTRPEQDMDEEVKVTKKRKPNPKLDQDRLLSSAGIPKLRRIAKDKLNFKGKGHEFSDISRMLNLYQLWLDDLYPKAKFKDGLAMVEKLGHTKRLQVSRRAWIDESKGHRRREDDDVEMRLGDFEARAQTENDAIFPVSKENGQSSQQNADGGADEPDEDELDALMGAQPHAAAAPSNAANTVPPKPAGPFQDDDDEPDDDELDALLNEDSRTNFGPPQEQPAKQKGPFEDDDDDQDELDMLLAEEPQNSRVNGSGNSASVDQQRQNGNGEEKEVDFADDEEAMAEMGW